MIDVSKSFPGVKALDNVNLRVRPHSVHALMGENGAGKSTLLKCLFGIYEKDQGKIFFKGQEINFTSSKEALENGARMGIREPAFFCIVGAIASTLWGIPKLWAYQASQLINRSHPYYIQNLMRCEARAGLSQVNLVAPRPSVLAWLWRKITCLFKGAA